MLNNHLHIVCLDTPYPVTYGGVYDLYYKLKTLHKQGIKIHLHCFAKKTEPQLELEKYCEEVGYYQRGGFSFSIPHIVYSRRNNALLQNLLKDDYPILLEGIHCTYHLFKNKLNNRKIFVRLHNVEYLYYKHLAKYESNIFKKLFYQFESTLLKKYEAKLTNKAAFIAVSQADADFYKTTFGATNCTFLPVFINEDIETNFTSNLGSYCLYQGNLSINENVEAVKWLVKNIFSTIDVPFVVAGKNPSNALIKFVHRYTNCCIIQNPSTQELNDLIHKAQINILPSLNNTGVKLKLINALQNGVHVLTNKAGVNGSGLDDLCNIAYTPTEFIEKINELMRTKFTENEFANRQQKIGSIFNNEANAKKLCEMIFG